MTKRLGFTLAEVLITLGIIGVVAAMTIPTLVANYQERSWGTAANVFNKKLTEALKVMNTQSTLAGYTTTEDFIKELSKHIKILNTCSNDKLQNCFSETVYWGGGTAEPKEVDMSVVKEAKNFGQADWGTNIVGVQFANGTNALIAYNPECKQDPYSNSVTGEDCIAILYDTTGFKTPNTSGKDLRSNGNVAKLGKYCFFEVGQTCYSIAPFKADPVTKSECRAMRSTHGIVACWEEQDYWAGAVKACGHVNKLPSEAQLNELANYLYNTDKIQLKGQEIATDVYNLTRDETKLASMGFTLNQYNGFNVWSSEEYENYISYQRSFTPTSTTYAGVMRNANGIQTICIE